MARARNIKPGFCRNEDLAECSVWARLCFALLPMQADREGRLEDRPKRIKAELFPFDSVEVEPLLIELELRGLIARYAVGGLGLIQILGFRKHQNPHHREPESVLPPHPALRLDPEGKYVKPEAQPGLHAEKAEARPALHDIKARGKPEAQPVLNGHRARGKPEASPGLSPHESSMDGPSAVLIPDSGFLIPDTGEEISDLSVARARPSADPPPAFALVSQADPAATGPPPDCPHLEVLALWAEVLPAMPQHLPEQWRGARADHLRTRWRETATAKGWTHKAQGLAYFRKLFAFIGRSGFLTGRTSVAHGKRPFAAELEWVVKPANWAKVHEGKYHEEATA